MPSRRLWILALAIVAAASGCATEPIREARLVPIAMTAPRAPLGPGDAFDARVTFYNPDAFPGDRPHRVHISYEIVDANGGRVDPERVFEHVERRRTVPADAPYMRTNLRVLPAELLPASDLEVTVVVRNDDGAGTARSSFGVVR